MMYSRKEVRKSIRKISALILTITLLALGLAGCGSSEKQAYTVSDDRDTEITTGIVDNFMLISQIPRQSHHEEQISDYLYSWAEERGFSPQKDEENNVIFDVPATEGMEESPLTVLQGHMDMVIAVEDGKTFDPQTDGITVINDGKELRADGTSLGADDGMGLATIMYCIENTESHGPLRIIFTTCEEEGMTGALALTEDSIEGAEYVINLDSESTKEVTTSSAAGVVINFEAEPASTTPQKEKAFEISIKRLLGGHSGLDIHKGHVNGIKALAYILNSLSDAGIDYELASFEGGNASNAIPSTAKAEIIIDSDDENSLVNIVTQCEGDISQMNDGVEKDVKVNLESSTMPEAVMTVESETNLLNFVEELQDGINSMSEEVQGLVESSSNLGLISFSADRSEKNTASTYIRSCNDEKLQVLINGQLSLAKEHGMNTEKTQVADPWPAKSDSRLLEMVKAAYLEETGEDISVVQIHAGLETGTFSRLNKDLDIVSIGIDIQNPHTINETCDLTTLPTAYGVLEKVLKAIGTEDN